LIWLNVSFIFLFVYIFSGKYVVLFELVYLLISAN